MGMRESEGCIRAMTPGNGYPPGPGRAKAARVGVIVRRDPWPALRRRRIMSPQLRTVVAREPRATSAEEPDGGNLQVRIW